MEIEHAIAEGRTGAETAEGPAAGAMPGAAGLVPEAPEPEPPVTDDAPARPKTDPFAPTMAAMESVEEPAIFTARDVPQSEPAPAEVEEQLATLEDAPPVPDAEVEDAVAPPAREDATAPRAAKPRETQPFGSGTHPTGDREELEAPRIDTANYSGVAAMASETAPPADEAGVEVEEEPYEAPSPAPEPATTADEPLSFTASSELDALDKLAHEPDPHRVPTVEQMDRLEQSTGPTDVSAVVDRAESEDLEETVAFVPQPRRAGLWVALGLVLVLGGLLALFLLTPNLLKLPGGEDEPTEAEAPAEPAEAPAEAQPAPAETDPAPEEAEALEETVAPEDEADEETSEPVAAVESTAVRLVLDSEPQRAAVYRGEAPLCVTPCDLDLDAPGGAERIRLVREGYETASIMVILSPGQEVRRLVKLDPVSRPAPRAGAKPAAARPRPAKAEAAAPPPPPAPTPEPEAAPPPAPPSRDSSKGSARSLRRVRLEAPARIKTPGVGTGTGAAPTPDDKPEADEPTGTKAGAAPGKAPEGGGGAAEEEEQPKPKKIKRKRTRKARVRLLDPGTDKP